MNNKLKPALIGGVVLGLLSALPFVGSCCCLWALLGGMLASYLYVKNSPIPASAADGAVLGAITGVVGAVIFLVLGIPIAYAMGPTSKALMIKLLENVDPRQAEMMRAQIEASSMAIGPMILQGLVLAVVIFIFSVIGGLIGIPLFEKRKGGTPPSPPINVGGATGGYAA